MVNKVAKILKGLNNVHFAKFNGEDYDVPVRIKYAKKIENTLNFETENDWADDEIVCTESGFSGGEGTLTTLGLTADEQALLFGSEKVAGGAVVKSSDIAPMGAFLFERKMKNSTAKRLFVVYACKCSPASFGGETIEEGKGAAGESEISYTITENSTYGIYYFIDTDGAGVDKEQIANWYKTVQKPKPVPTIDSRKNRVVKKEE